MESVKVILACLLCAEHVFANQYVIYSATHVAKVITFNIKIYPSGDTVNAAAISNTNGDISTGTSANACSYTTSTSPVQLTAGNDGSAYLEFEVVIDHTNSPPKFQTTGGTELGCDFTTVDADQGQFRFYVRGLASSGGSVATDKEYTIQSSGTAIINNIEIGSTSFQGASFTVTAIGATSYSVGMTVVDSPGHADQTRLNLGKTAQLKFVMTVNPHECPIWVPIATVWLLMSLRSWIHAGRKANMDLSGARLTNCVVDKSAAFNVQSVTFIGANGCFRNVDIFDNMNTNVGFSKDASSGKSGSTKTFIAYSPKFEMSAFTKNPVNAANALYFRCDIKFCFDDSDTTAGTCGGNHCDPTRKKRDIHDRPDTTVMASVNINITDRDTSKSCSQCTDSKMFRVTVGGLATTVAIVFGVMTLSFTAAKTAGVARSQRQRKTIPKISTSLATQSVTGSDVKNNRGDLSWK